MNSVRTPSESERYLICRIRSCACALPLGCLVETMRPFAAEPLGAMPSYIRGLAIVRGEPLPVVNGGVLLGFLENGQPQRWIVLRVAERKVVLEVEDVFNMRDLTKLQLADLPPLLSEAGKETISSLGTLDAELLVVLNTARLVPDSTWDGLEAGQQGAKA